MKDEMSKVTETKFQAAVNVIRSLPKNGPYQPSHDMMLKFYGLYKQATEGPCKEPKPSFFDVVRGYKWKAWNANGNMTKEQAMDLYVEELKKIVETMSYSDDVALFIQTLGPFYEFVEIPALKNIGQNSTVSEEVPSKGNGVHKSLMEDEHHVQKDNMIMEQRNITSTMSSDGRLPLNGHRTGINNHYEDKVLNDVEKVYNGHLEDSLKPRDAHYSNGLHVNHSSNSSRKLISETDSDEEYSEPAECLEVLKQDHLANLYCGVGDTSDDISYQLQNFAPFQATQTGSSSKGISDYGGADGDRVHNLYGSNYGQESNEDHRTNGAGLPRGPGGILPSTSGGGGGRRRGNSGQQRTISSANDFDSHLLAILRKIQRDIEAVAHRMDALEVQALHHHNQICGYCQRHIPSHAASSEQGRPHQWPFSELSSRTTFLLLAWPLVLGGAVSLLQKFRRRNQRQFF